MFSVFDVFVWYYFLKRHLSTPADLWSVSQTPALNSSLLLSEPPGYLLLLRHMADSDDEFDRRRRDKFRRERSDMERSREREDRRRDDWGDRYAHLSWSPCCCRPGGRVSPGLHLEQWFYWFYWVLLVSTQVYWVLLGCSQVLLFVQCNCSPRSLWVVASFKVL